jgi:hypothetical protein
LQVITNPNDGTVYQKGISAIRTEDGSDSIKTIYESVSSSDNDSQNYNRNLVLDNGAMFFDPSSSCRGEPQLPNNKIAFTKT